MDWVNPGEKSQAVPNKRRWKDDELKSQDKTKPPPKTLRFDDCLLLFFRNMGTYEMTDEEQKQGRDDSPSVNIRCNSINIPQ